MMTPVRFSPTRVARTPRAEAGQAKQFLFSRARPDGAWAWLRGALLFRLTWACRPRAPGECEDSRVYRTGREGSRKLLLANQGNAQRPFIIFQVPCGHVQNTPLHILVN